jgi:phage-related holin
MKLQGILADFMSETGITSGDFTWHKLLIALLAFLAPLTVTATAIIALMGIDFITALISAKRNKVPITSSHASNSVSKAFIYMLLLLAAYICDKLIGISICVKAAAYFLAIVELISIGENFQKLTGLPLVAYMKKIIQEKIKAPKEVIDELNQLEPDNIKTNPTDQK